MLVGPDSPVPEIGPEYNSTLRSNFGSAPQSPTNQNPKKSQFLGGSRWSLHFGAFSPIPGDKKDLGSPSDGIFVTQESY